MQENKRSRTCFTAKFALFLHLALLLPVSLGEAKASQQGASPAQAKTAAQLPGTDKNAPSTTVLRPSVSPEVQAVMKKLLADKSVQKALAFIDADQQIKIDELKEMTLLHGAPFQERELRSPMYKAKFEKYGLTQCSIDSEGNATGILGSGKARPQILLEAHLDTVFPKETTLAITEKNGRISAPGIGDNTAAMATVLSVLRAIRHAGLVPVGRVMVAGTVGEEGEGDIRGMKALLRTHKDIDACISFEPGPAGAITLGAVGSRRYDFVFTGPGGHSFGAYGLPSPLHAMGRATAKMADVVTPDTPKTTYTIGLVSGGTSVNSIANQGSMKLDMRSVSPKALAELEATMLRLVDQGVAEENSFRGKSGKKIAVEKILIGDRPAGDQDPNSVIMQTTWAAWEAVGVAPKFTAPSSTNANAPISLGIPAVVARTGGKAGRSHALDEWFEPEGSQKGAQQALLMLFAMAGLEGVTEPLALPLQR